MKVYTLNGVGENSRLQLENLNIPEINKEEVLVKVKAISINPVDIQTRNGKGIYQALKNLQPLILGWDISGIVVGTGDAVTTFKKNDAVFGMVNFPGHGAAYAEYVKVPASHLALKPDNVSFEQAASATLAALTAYQGIVKKAKVHSGQKVMIHAASGGVGHFAVQIAKHLGAYVIGTSSSRNRDFVLQLGADEHVDYNGNDLEQKVADCDFAFDCAGGDTAERSLSLMKKGGTIIGITGINDNVVSKAKDLHIDAYFFLVESNGEDMNAIAELMAKEVLKPHLSKIFSFDNIEDAHLAIGSGRTIGKVVVTI